MAVGTGCVACRILFLRPALHHAHHPSSYPLTLSPSHSLTLNLEAEAQGVSRPGPRPTRTAACTSAASRSLNGRGSQFLTHPIAHRPHCCPPSYSSHLCVRGYSRVQSEVRGTSQPGRPAPRFPLPELLLPPPPLHLQGMLAGVVPGPPLAE